MRQTSHTASLVIVEDSSADYETIRVILSEAGFEAPLTHYRTGEEVLQRIETAKAQPPSERQRQVPAHILLDLNLPGLSGLDVLTEIRGDSLFASVPVSIFTTSSDPRDIEECYRAGANSYLIKPLNFERMENILRGFTKYWFDLAESPGFGTGIGGGATV